MYQGHGKITEYWSGDAMQLFWDHCIKITGNHLSRRKATMPMFEFVCNECESQFEDLIFGTDLSGVVCPVCGGNQVKKKMSTFASKIGGISFNGNKFSRIVWIWQCLRNIIPDWPCANPKQRAVFFPIRLF